MPGYYLFLDDIRCPNDVLWVQIPRDHVYEVVRSYDEFVDCIINNGIPNFVTFDHDLADEHYVAMLQECEGKEHVDYGVEKSGYDCAKWLVHHCAEIGLMFPNYMVHSMNPIGKERIDAYIVNAKKHLNI
jgi:hypothetical protein